MWSVSNQGKVCGSLYPPTIARQCLSTHGYEELLEALFPLQSMSYQRKVGDYFFPELFVYLFAY
jgi:hypothetical protein